MATPSDLELAAQIKTQLLQRIADVTRNPKPTYNIDGQMVDWNGYLDVLMRRLKDVDDQIERGDGPFEFNTQIYT